MKPQRKFYLKELIQTVAEALHAAGVRPSVITVREWIVAQFGEAPSYRDIAPQLAEWKAKREDSPAVKATVTKYQSLDPTEQHSFRKKANLLPGPKQKKD